MATNVPVTLDTLITIKILFQGHNKKFKIPLRDLGAQVLPDKLRTLLYVDPNDEVVFERYSDSAGAYVTLDADKPQVYKTLFRAAKAKLKLRLKATLLSEENEPPASDTIPSDYPAPPSPLPSSSHRLSAGPSSPPVVSQPSPAIVYSPVAPLAFNVYHKPEVETAQVSPISPLVVNRVDDGEAHVPQPFPAHEKKETPEKWMSLIAGTSHSADLALRPKETASWVVFCNQCNQAMEDEHFHCSICDGGDYDLCPSCVDAGVHCPGAGHWMVKRFLKNGIVVNSTTERIGPKAKVETEKEMPGAFTTDNRSTLYEAEPTRTCNSCVKVYPENDFVTCTSCDDYDLCLECHIGTKHGHHPGHAFKGATQDTKLTALADFLCNAGRNVRHSAVCDGCEKFIYGVRHKCLNCPDWDFCSECIKNAKYIHPRHRFVPIYEPLAEPISTAVRHHGIYCDGPLCKDKENMSYIEGVRYKCAVCHDTDFCANCEAIPANRHNRTHPLIKFKTPVRSVSVTTMGEDKNGVGLARMGDQPARKSASTETIPVASSANAATQVQTIVDMKPTEESQSKPIKDKMQIRDLLAEPVQERIKIQDLLIPAAPVIEKVPQCANIEAVSISKMESNTLTDDLDAHFIRDTITDGSKLFAGFQFVQVWTLRNPGPNAWPAGCSVRHVGGDNMLNIDNSQPLSHSELAEASESNVVGRCVEPGEEISFRIVMKAPKREGTAISYWRLKTADGTPFGHRLWCDIQVVAPPVPTHMPSPPQPSVVEAASDSAGPSSPTHGAHPEQIHQAKMERLRQIRQAFLREREQMRTQESEVRAQSNRERSTQEKILHIQQVRRAAVERLLETRRKEQEALVSATREISPESEKVEYAPNSEQDIKVEHQEEQSARGIKPEASTMIFPQLEKESPVSSTHEAVNACPEPEDVKSENVTVAAPSETDDTEFFEDAESVDIMNASSDDDGFMTDEEYDILDASDEEMP